MAEGDQNNLELTIGELLRREQLLPVGHGIMLRPGDRILYIPDIQSIRQVTAAQLGEHATSVAVEASKVNSEPIVRIPGTRTDQAISTMPRPNSPISASGFYYVPEDGILRAWAVREPNQVAASTHSAGYTRWAADARLEDTPLRTLQGLCRVLTHDAVRFLYERIKGMDLSFDPDHEKISIIANESGMEELDTMLRSQLTIAGASIDQREVDTWVSVEHQALIDLYEIVFAICKERKPFVARYLNSGPRKARVMKRGSKTRGYVQIVLTPIF